VSQFIDDAVEILEAAETAMVAGHIPCEYSILLSSQGGIRMIADSDWPLASLQREHGAYAAYRVSATSGRLSVDGRDGGSRTCHFEATPPAKAAQFLLNSVPCWHSSVQAELRLLS
jgi:hypothetical protein